MTYFGYRICVWRSVYHNGEYSHPLTRWVTVHATTESAARAAVDLAPARPSQEIHDGLTVSASEEAIHSIEFLGRVEYETVARYMKEG